MRVNSQKNSVEENSCSKEELEPSEQEVRVQEADSGTKTGSPSRVQWSSVAVNEMRRLFHKEILEKSLSLKSVKEKIAGSEILEEENPKRVYDRVRAEWRFPVSDDNTDPSLPTETEEMQDRVDCMFRKDAPSEDVTTTSDIVPPTTISSRAKALFTEDHVRTLHRLFNDMLGNVPISRNEILKRLSADVEGKKNLAVLSITQVVNRIKYERRQKREKEH